jgi:hypothetical protein
VHGLLLFYIVSVPKLQQLWCPSWTRLWHPSLELNIAVIFQVHVQVWPLGHLTSPQYALAAYVFCFLSIKSLHSKHYQPSDMLIHWQDPYVPPSNHEAQSHELVNKVKKNSVFKHPVVLIYLLHTYISVLNATYYLVTLLPHYMFSPHMAIIRCLSC